MLSLKIIACFAALTASGVRVLNVESNLDQLTPGWLPGPGDGAGAVLKRPRFPLASDYTACFRFQFAKLKRINILFRVSTNGTRPLLQLDINVEKLRVVAAYQYRYLYLERWLQPRRWYSVCMMYQRANQTVTGVLDGRIVGEINLVKVTTTPATNVTFGFIDPNIYPALSFIGNVTQFNIWSRILSADELSDQASCKSSAPGDFVSWEEEWSLQNVVQYDLVLSDLCPKEAPLGLQVFPVMSHQEGTHVCEALGGTLKVPNNMAEVEHMYLSTQRRTKNCRLIWIGVTDEGEEGVWRKERSGTLASDLPWAFDEPNGQLFENCGGIDLEGVIDDNCKAKRCPLCSVADNVAMVLRGSCEEHIYNMNFMMLLKNDGMVFEGYGDYRIILTNETWTWLNIVHDTIIGQMIISRYNYPLGRQRWKLHRPVCGQQAGQVRQLLITMCQDGQYSCGDGTCIPLSKRCDMKYDCFDSSDEAECELIRLPPEYKTNVAPRPVSNGAKGESRKMLQILANISLENLRVDTSEMLLEASFNLSLTWYETRALYVNLKNQVSLNLLDTSQVKLWLPSVGFLNTIDNAVSVTDRQSSTHVVRRGRSKGADNAVAEEVRLYLGSENPIVSSRKYQGFFTCDFDLTSYPFDHQTCFMKLQLRSAFRDDVRWDVEGSQVQYLGNPLLLEYQLGSFIILPKSSTGDDSILLVSIPMTRLVGYAVISIYLPSLIMLIIGYLTLFFINDNFEVRVMTALTTLLVMATLFTQVSSSLPKTSYFKLVDVWLLFCIFSTFLIIIFHIIIDLSLHSESTTETKINTGSIPVQRRSVALRGNSNVAPFFPSSPSPEAWKMPKKTSSKVSWFKKMSVLDIERFARWLMAAVFLVFNIFYWLKAYGFM